MSIRPTFGTPRPAPRPAAQPQPARLTPPPAAKATVATATKPPHVDPSALEDGLLRSWVAQRRLLIVHLLDGAEIGCRLDAFDRYGLLVRVDGSDSPVLLFKHACVLVECAGPTTNGEAG